MNASFGLCCSLCSYTPPSFFHSKPHLLGDANTLIFRDYLWDCLFFRCDSISQHLPLSVSGWVSGSLMFSDFGDSYRIYRACELVSSSPTKRWRVCCVLTLYLPSSSSDHFCRRLGPTPTAPLLSGHRIVLRISIHKLLHHFFYSAPLLTTPQSDEIFHV